MNRSWFNTPERIALLEFKAAKWLGTPWFPNGNTPGMGVSCQELVSAIYREVGFCNVKLDQERMTAKGLKESKVEKFMGERREFERIEPRACAPGDMLGFKMYEVVHHVGIVISENTFIHVLYRDRVRLCSILDGTWSAVLRAAWRPIE